MHGSTCNVQGLLEPKVCDAGWYCPPGGKQRIQCPAGTFCPQGSYQPWNCSFGAICPAESQRQIVTVPVGVMAAIDGALLLLVAIGSGISKRRKSRPKKYTTLDIGDGNVEDVELLRSPGMSGRASPRLSVSGPAGESANVPSPGSTHTRRASGRVDHWGNMDGYAVSRLQEPCPDISFSRQNLII